MLKERKILKNINNKMIKKYIFKTISKTRKKYNEKNLKNLKELLLELLKIQQKVSKFIKF